MNRSKVLFVIIFTLFLSMTFQNCGSFKSSLSPAFSGGIPAFSSGDFTANRGDASSFPTVEWIRALTGNWSSNPLSSPTEQIHTPIGWGYMNPMILVDGDDQYALTLNSCTSPADISFGKTQCGYIVKNGSEILDLGFNLGQSYDGAQGSHAYQPPMLFKHGQKLMLAYWMLLSEGSTIQLIGLDLNKSKKSWAKLASYNTSGTINYLGGAMSSDGMIVIAGLSSQMNKTALAVVSIDPPYTNFSDAVVAYQSSGPEWTPLYPHVSVDSNKNIDLFFTLQNNTQCAEPTKNADGSLNYPIYTSYKNVINIRGTMVTGFHSVWSDAAPDVAVDPQYSGDNCFYNSSRFPLDLLVDEDDTRYFLYRADDLAHYNLKKGEKTASNNFFKRKFILTSSKGFYFDKLADHFSFQNNEQIDAMSMTKLSDGRFVFFANSRSSILSGLQNHINIIATRDFVNFEGPWTYSTPYGVGHSIKLAQPNKNGGRSPSCLDFYHGGDLYQKNGASDGNWGLIEYSQFQFYRFKLPNSPNEC